MSADLEIAILYVFYDAKRSVTKDPTHRPAL